MGGLLGVCVKGMLPPPPKLLGAGGCPPPPRRRPLPTPMIEQKIVLTVISSHLINCMVAKIRMCSISFLDHSTYMRYLIMYTFSSVRKIFW